MLKKQKKDGVWTRLNYADGESLNKLSSDFQAAVNDYRNNPNADTEKAMNDKNDAFKKAWKAIK